MSSTDWLCDDDVATLMMPGNSTAPTSARASALSVEPNACMRMPGMAVSDDGPVYSCASALIGQLGIGTGGAAATPSSEPRPASTSPGHSIDARANACPPAWRLAEVRAMVPSNGACTMVKPGRVGKAENTSPLPALW